MTADTIMTILEQVARNIGFAFMLVGGLLLFGAMVTLGIRLMCELWAGVSLRFRNICKAESLIIEYRKNREKFLEWLEMEKKKEDCNGQT